MCPSCNSTEISRSRKKKLADAFMRWMGKIPYRCRECHRRFYLSASLDRRLRKDHDWRRKSAEEAHFAQRHPAQPASRASTQEIDIDDYEHPDD